MKTQFAQLISIHTSFFPAIEVVFAFQKDPSCIGQIQPKF